VAGCLSIEDRVGREGHPKAENRRLGGRVLDRAHGYSLGGNVLHPNTPPWGPFCLAEKERFSDSGHDSKESDGGGAYKQNFPWRKTLQKDKTKGQDKECSEPIPVGGERKVPRWTGHTRNQVGKSLFTNGRAIDGEKYTEAREAGSGVSNDAQKRQSPVG